MSFLHAASRQQQDAKPGESRARSAQPSPRVARTLVREREPGWLKRAPRLLYALLRQQGYKTGIYDWRLKGKLPLQMTAIVEEARRTDAARARAIADTGELPVPLPTSAGDGQASRLLLDHLVWEKLDPAHPLFSEMHAFGWVRDLAEHSSLDTARRVIQPTVATWCARFECYDADAWAPHLLARRITNWLVAAPIILGSNDLVYRSAVLVQLGKQTRHLTRVIRDLDGYQRIEAAVTLILAGYLLPDGEPWLRAGTREIDAILPSELRPDGGARRGRYRDLVNLVERLVLLFRAARATQSLLPQSVRAALDRAGPFLRAYHLADGGLSGLAGAEYALRPHAEALLSEVEADGAAQLSAPFSGLQRIERGGSVLVLDTAPPPAPSLSPHAAASTGALDFSSGKDRLFGSIGTTSDPELKPLTRATAAYSVTVLDDRNASPIEAGGLIGRGVTAVTLKRTPVTDATSSYAGGEQIELGHDGYAKRLGWMVDRQITVSEDGLALMGEETFRATKRRAKAVEAVIRFHLHPDVTITEARADEQGTASSQASETEAPLVAPMALRLVTKSGKVWLFSCDRGIAREQSIYFDAGGVMRATQQLSIVAPVSVQAKDKQVSVLWHLKRLS